MVDRKATGGTPKASPAKARATTPRKTAKTAKSVLPVTTRAEKVASPPAPPVKAKVLKAAKPSAPVKTETVKIEAVPAVPFEAPVAEPVVTPASPAPEISAALIGDAVAEPVAQAEEIVANIQETVKEGIEVMDAKTQTIEAGKTAADQAQAFFGDINERAKGVMEKNAKIAQEVTDLSKGNVEAIVASSRVAAKGVESLSREAAEYGRKSFEDASAALKSFSEVRSPADLFRLQSDYVRSYFDSMVAETSKMSEAVLKIAGEVAEPITNRYSVAAEKVRAIAL